MIPLKMKSKIKDRLVKRMRGTFRNNNIKGNKYLHSHPNYQITTGKKDERDISKKDERHSETVT